jgi:glyoxylase-like metal-dependent hydrolase (beta-lactamase superfamily II)
MNLHTLTPRVRWLPADPTTDRPILGVVSGAGGSLLVDAGNSPAHAGLLIREMERAGLPPPRFLMLTHWHWDHVFGAASIDAPALAHSETARAMRVMAGLDWGDAALDERVAAGTEIAFCRDMIRAELPDRSGLTVRPPEIAIEGEATVDLGDLSCRLIHVGGDHAHDSTIAFVPQERVVFLGDCLYDDLHHGARRLTAGQLFPLLERLLALEADHYLPAHHDAPLTRAEMEAEARLLTTIGRAVTQIGDDREAILAALPGLLGAPLSEDHAEVADAFLAGLRMPSVRPVL